MDRLLITGGNTLLGEVTISGAKNAALPLMCAALLTDQPLILSNVPELADITTLRNLLEHMGVEINKTEATDAGSKSKLEIRSGASPETTAPYDIVRQMRASILVFGPLLARMGRAKVSLPGGCAIGNRPIDLHIRGLEKLGAKIELEDGYVTATVDGRLKGSHVHMPLVSVGATENILMAASLAKGQTIIDNAAREPEIDDLISCLNKMGARISGKGTERLIIDGVESLSGASHSVIPDRIEAGSYAVAAVITGGSLRLKQISPHMMQASLNALLDMGATVEPEGQDILVSAGSRLGCISLKTQPFPGFATDMQAQFMALASVAEGMSVISETIFENRFMHVPELRRMGAEIAVNGAVASLAGNSKLYGAEVMATDLRASMGLALAALVASGETIISRVYHLDRGYEKLEEKLRAVGASIERIQEQDKPSD